MDVNNNFDKWNNISKELKFAEANQQLQNDLFYFLDKIGVKVETTSIGLKFISGMSALTFSKSSSKTIDILLSC